MRNVVNLCCVLLLAVGCEAGEAAERNSGALPSAAPSPLSTASSPSQLEPPNPVSAENKKAPPALATDCAKICAVAIAKSCLAEPDPCLEACSQMTGVDGCSKQMAAALHCMGRTEADGWGCGEGGFPQLKEGYCSAEQEQYVRCVAQADR